MLGASAKRELSSMSSIAPFAWSVRVYWEDTDAGGVVYHASYLRFMERARSEWLRARGVDQSALREATGLAFMVRSMQLDFLRPALLDDELAVTVAVKEWRSASILFSQAIGRADGAELVRAQVRVACVDLNRMRPAPIPADLIPGLVL
jgi:acyl-CoA thioester hydrolase